MRQLYQIQFRSRSLCEGPFAALLEGADVFGAKSPVKVGEELPGGAAKGAVIPSSNGVHS